MSFAPVLEFWQAAQGALVLETTAFAAPGRPY